MMAMLSTEFWVAFQMVTILLLLMLLVYFIRHSKAGRDEKNDGSESAAKMVALMEPLLNEAESVAKMFESQIMEKKHLIHELNEKLDSRIISLNLLLNRADAFLARPMAPSIGETIQADRVHDTQKAILELYQKGLDPQAISRELSVSGQEVDLVIALKKKFIAMDKDS